MRRRRPTWSSRLRRAGSLMLLGMITCVGVSWGLAGIAHTPAGTRLLNVSRTLDFEGLRSSYRGLGISVSVDAGGRQSGSIGFPFLAMSFARGAEPLARRGAGAEAFIDLYTRGLDMPLSTGASGWVAPPLPLKPRWPGFGLDAALYAVLWWSALASIRVMRERRRFGRGLCPKCGYDVTRTPGRCPECGAARPIK